MTIESDIITWGLERPGWQQDVLVALANGEQYGSERVTAVVDEILAGTNSAPSQEAKSIQVKSAVVEQVDLTAVADLRGVNALVDGQRLNLATAGITVIYGDNGSGKSGYAPDKSDGECPTPLRHPPQCLPGLARRALRRAALPRRGQKPKARFPFSTTTGAAEDELLRRTLRGRVPD